MSEASLILGEQEYKGCDITHSGIRSMYVVVSSTNLQQQIVKRFPLGEALSQHILSANAILPASRHTSMDRGPADHGKYCTLVFHICETAIDTLCAGRLVTVSWPFTLPQIKIHIICTHAFNRIIPKTYEFFMNLHYEKNYFLFIFKREQVSHSITGFS